jgi:uncharacterized membrane protein
MATFKTLTRFVLGAAFVVAGLNHFRNPGFYVGIVPPYLPWPVALVYISGVAEIVLGALLWFPPFTVAAAWGLMALLIAVFPANVHMAVHPELYPAISPTALWVRLPIQGLLIAWAYGYARRSTGARVTSRA